MLTALIFVSAFVIGSPDEQTTLDKRVERLECQHLLDRIDIDELESEILALRLNGPMLSEKDRAALQNRRSEILRRAKETVDKDGGARFRYCHDLIEAGR